MIEDFDLKSLKKIAKEEMEMEKSKELNIAKDIIDNFEEDIIDEINRTIVEALKKDKSKIEINVSKLECLKDRKDLNVDVYSFIMEHFYGYYRKKGFYVDRKMFHRYIFYIFNSRYDKWKHKLYVIVYNM